MNHSGTCFYFVVPYQTNVARNFMGEKERLKTHERNAIRNVEETHQPEELLKMIPVKLSVESCRHGFSYSTIEQIIEILGQVETFDSRKKWLRTRFAERGERIGFIYGLLRNKNVYVMLWQLQTVV